MKRFLLAGAVLISACAEHEAEKEKKAKAEISATVATVSAERFTETVDAIGVVATRPGHSASLAAPSQARVTKLFVSAGARVKAGDPLVEFEQASFEAAVNSAEAMLATAEKGAQRAQRLADAGVSPRREAEVASAELGAARATAINARRARELATLRAPIGGVVTRMVAVLGANAEPSQVLVEVADPAMIDVLLTIDPAATARVAVGQAVALFDGTTGTGTAIGQGRVADIGIAIDTASRGVVVRVTVSGEHAGLRLGATVLGRVTIAEHAKAVVVPLDALVPSGEGFKVFVVDTAGIAMSHEVKIGGRSEKGVWVTEGVKAGAHVVTKGAYGVEDSAKIVRGDAKKPEAKTP